jgi:hypothetical protein
VPRQPRHGGGSTKLRLLTASRLGTKGTRTPSRPQPPPQGMLWTTGDSSSTTSNSPPPSLSTPSQPADSPPVVVPPPSGPATPPRPGTKRKITRTRTGCQTCRDRKVKCGEEKPQCLNCQRTNHVCPGYAPATVFKARRGSRQQQPDSASPGETDGSIPPPSHP